MTPVTPLESAFTKTAGCRSSFLHPGTYVTYLESTLAEVYQNKGLYLPLESTLTQKPGGGGQTETRKGGEGDRSQGCAGPRGRTLHEDQARSVSRASVTSG